METVQLVYYSLGILFYIILITFFSVLTYAVWQLYQKVKDAPEEIKEKVTALLSSKKVEMASMAGMFVSSIVLARLKDRFFGKK